jgi:hypothetical protein
MQTIYIYLGVAALVGLAIGVIVNYVHGSISGALALNSVPEPPPGRTVKQYREAKRKQKARVEAAHASPVMLSPANISPTQLSPSYLSMSDGARVSRRSKGLLSQTIMEEMDSDY